MSKSLLFLLLLILAFPISANPFLSDGEEQLPQAPRRGAAPIEKLVQWQLGLKDSMSGYFKRLDEEDRNLFLLSILSLSFLYGVLHAAGPGHRKTIVFSLFIGRESRWWEPAAAGFFSAGLHGMSGMVLILILYAISHRMLGNRVNRLSLYFEGFTYILLFSVALLMLFLHIRSSRKEHKEDSGGDYKNIYSVLAAGSLFPCPGAIMILLFSLAVDKLGAGIMALIALSLGMGVTVSVAAYLAMLGRRGFFFALKHKAQRLERLSFLMEGGAYSFLMLYSAWAVLPFIISLIS